MNLDKQRLVSRLPGRTQRQLEGRVGTVLVDNADGTIDVDLAGLTLTVPIVADVTVGQPVTLMVWDGNLVALALVPYVLPNPLVSTTQTPPNWSQHLYFDGTNNTRIDMPDDADSSPTGDLDIAVLWSADDWTPGTDQSLFGKWLDTGNQRSFLLSLLVAGNLRLLTSADGSALINTTSTAIVALTPGTKYWLRATIDVVSGANRVVKFYTAPTNSATDFRPGAWTQLGTTITTAGTTSILNSTAKLMIGGNNDGAGFPPKGQGYGAILNNVYDTADLNATFKIRILFGQTHPTAWPGVGWPPTSLISNGDDSPAQKTWTLRGTVQPAMTMDEMLVSGAGVSINLTTGRTLFNELIGFVEWEETLVAVTGAYADIISRTVQLPFAGETCIVELSCSAYATDLSENETLFITPRMTINSVILDGGEIAAASPDATGGLGSLTTAWPTGPTFSAGTLDTSGTGFQAATSGGPVTQAHGTATHSVIGAPGVGGSLAVTGAPSVSLADVRSVLAGIPFAVGPVYVSGTSITVALRAKGTNYTGTPRFRIVAKVTRAWLP